MFNKTLSKLLLFLLSSTTLATSAAAGIKIAKNLSASTPQVAGISIESVPTPTPVSPIPASDDATPPTNSTSPTPTSKPVPTPTPTKGFKPAAVIAAALSTVLSGSTPSPTSTCNPPPSNLCLITLFGQQFDVTSLRSTHSGGDIFQCGTDMTSIYQNQHGTSLSRMQPYIYHASTCTTTSTSSSSSSSSSNPQPTVRPVFHQIEDEDVDKNELEKTEQPEIEKSGN